MSLEAFHPAVAAWFRKGLGEPTAPQALAWPAIRRGGHALIAAPTGSGKTLAAFLAAIDELVRLGLSEGLPDATRVVYVSPLKALSNDIRRNLEEPLRGIAGELSALGLGPVEIRTLVRTGDTPQSERAAMRKRPPHILVTTPESLYILLTSDGGRGILRTARTVIVDEIHAVAGSKRGSHLALSLERLEALCGRPLQRIGLSATQRPIEDVARFLAGGWGEGPPRAVEIVDVGHRRDLDLTLEVPGSPLEAVMSAEVWEEIYDRLAALIGEHRTTLVFVNTRRLAERVTRHLAERLGEEAVTSHHGSLSRERRLAAEERLKAGELRALVATASLELGIDIGAVELVCQLGTPRAIATLLQRVGRSGHHLGGLPKGRLFPLSRDELVECAALLQAVRKGELERVRIPREPLDILAQQVVAAVACEEWREEDLLRLVRRAYPYRDLPREAFEAVVRMLAEGFITGRGRRRAYLHHDQVNGRLRARRGARLTAVTSGGAIPDSGDYHVILEPTSTFIGTVNEDFAVESLPGNIFQLGNTSWRILRVEPGRVLVEDARGEPPNIPFWLGEAPGRSDELSAAVSRLREEIDRRLAQVPADSQAAAPSGTAAGVPADSQPPSSPGALAPFDLAGGETRLQAVQDWLVADLGLPSAAASQMVEYLAAGRAALGALPTQETVILERFFDEAGDMHLVLHAPFGSRLNRAWGLALRKRFCRTFNFELQAAATEDAIILSLGPTHSFPLEEVFRFLHSKTVREVLTQAVLDAPLFPVRWRWNASRALALPRFRGGRPVPTRLQRQEAEDLLALVFPDQLACLENVAGDREIPDHPLVQETLRDCLEEAMDIGGLEGHLRRMEAGEVRLLARDLTEPSPLSQEVLSARPYAFLDDAPLEERRTLAVRARRFLDPETAATLGALDPAAIQRVLEEAWPVPETADELHDALVVLGFLTAEEGRRGGWEPLFQELVRDRRATVLTPGDQGLTLSLWIAAERLPELRALYPGARLEPSIVPPNRLAPGEWGREAAAVEILRGRLSALGPVTAGELAASSALPGPLVEAALAALEAEGAVLRGRFRPAGPSDGPGAPATEWCERGLLARIHRLTLDRLRREIQPVSKADFLRFLCAWQRLAPGEQGTGPEGLAAILEILEGFEAPAAAWEGEILPARLEEYDPAWLDALCLSGRYVWARLTPPAPGGRNAGPVRSTPIALVRRETLPLWQRLATRAALEMDHLSPPARKVYDHLAATGASFFGDIASGTGLLKTQVEGALAELVALGLAAADSFTGLRALLVPESLRPAVDGRRRRGSVAVFGMETAGRWSLLARPLPEAETPISRSLDDPTVAAITWTLLRRYGVVFRRLLDRESLLPPWRDLAQVYRRLEARGEIRGGRFVDGFSGEQYALSEAVGRLRAIRRRETAGELVSLSAADPLNLAGIVIPGDRVPALAGNRLLYRDGVPLAIYEGRQVRFLAELEPAAQWQARNALLRRTVPPQLRAYLGRSA